MKWRFLLAALTFCACFQVSALTPDDVNAIASYRPRDEGSSAEAALLDKLEEIIASHGYKSVRRSLDYLPGAYSFSFSLETFIPGSGPDEVVYAAPINAPDASILAVLATFEALAKSKRAPVVGARFLFFGAELGSESYYPMGTNEFLRNYAPKNRSSVVYFNLSKPYIAPRLSGSGVTVTPAKDLRMVYESLKRGGLKPRLPVMHLWAARTGLIETKSLAEPFLQKFIGATLVSDDMRRAAPVAENEARWADSMASAFLANHFNGDLLAGAYDIHYLLFGSLFIPESVYLAVLVAILSLLLIFGRFGRSLYKRGEINFRRDSINFIVLYGFLFLFVFLSGLISENILLIQNDANFWRYRPILFGLFKITAAMTFVSFFFRAIGYGSLAKTPQFYAAAAGLACIVNIIVFSLLNIAWAPLWTWYLVVVALFFSRVKDAFLKRIAAILAAAPPVVVAYAFFQDSYYSIIQFFLFSSIKGNIAFTLIIMPGALLAFSLHQQEWKATLVKRSRVTFLMPAIFSVVSFLALCLYDPYRTSALKRPVNVHIVYNIDENTSEARLVSPRALGSFTLTVSGRKYTFFNAPRSATLALKPEFGVDLTVSSEQIYNRTVATIVIASSRNPASIKLRVLGDQEFGAVDGNFPITLIRDGKGENAIAVHIGKNPPMPVEVKLTLDGPETLRVEADLGYPIEDVTISPAELYDLSGEARVLKSAPPPAGS